jgi:hypothetical protein
MFNRVIFILIWLTVVSAGGLYLYNLGLNTGRVEGAELIYKHIILPE